MRLGAAKMARESAKIAAGFFQQTHRSDGERVAVSADEKLTAFLELESQLSMGAQLTAGRAR